MNLVLWAWSCGHVVLWACGAPVASFPAQMLTMPLLAYFPGPLSCAIIMEWCDMGKRLVLICMCCSIAWCAS